MNRLTHPIRERVRLIQVVISSSMPARAPNASEEEEVFFALSDEEEAEEGEVSPYPFGPALFVTPGLDWGIVIRSPLLLKLMEGNNASPFGRKSKAMPRSLPLRATSRVPASQSKVNLSTSPC